MEGSELKAGFLALLEKIKNNAYTSKQQDIHEYLTHKEVRQITRWILAVEEDFWLFIPGDIRFEVVFLLNCLSKRNLNHCDRSDLADRIITLFDESAKREALIFRSPNGDWDDIPM